MIMGPSRMWPPMLDKAADAGRGRQCWTRPPMLDEAVKDEASRLTNMEKAVKDEMARSPMLNEAVK